MFQGKNLCSIHEAKTNKWVNKVMRHLFTPEELTNGLIIENNLKSKPSRIPLDNERVQLLKEALFVKYIVHESKQEAYWDEYMKVANNFCRNQNKPTTTTNHN